MAGNRYPFVARTISPAVFHPNAVNDSRKGVWNFVHSEPYIQQGMVLYGRLAGEDDRRPERWVTLSVTGRSSGYGNFEIKSLLYRRINELKLSYIFRRRLTGLFNNRPVLTIDVVCLMYACLFLWAVVC